MLSAILSWQSRPPGAVNFSLATESVAAGRSIKCHNLKIITTKRASEEEWTRSVDNMVNRGAVLSDDEADEVIDYLSHNFKPAESDQKQRPDNGSQK